MGASIGIAQGMKHAGIERPVLAAMGDGTFYHNGIAGLLNAVQSGVNLTLIILDNSCNAMTGMQPDLGTGKRTDGTPQCTRRHRYDCARLRRRVRQAARPLRSTQDDRYIGRRDATLRRRGRDCRGAWHDPGRAYPRAGAGRPGRLPGGRGCDDTPCYHKVGCPSVLLSLDDIGTVVSPSILLPVSPVVCALPPAPMMPFNPSRRVEWATLRKAKLFAGSATAGYGSGLIDDDER